MPVRVLKGAVNVSEVTLHRLRHKAENGKMIFNPDDKRIQLPISRNLAVVRRAEAALKDAGIIRAGRSLTSPVLLHSRAGCKRQPWHCDYDPDRVENSRSLPPMGVLVALEGDTFFDTPGKLYKLDAGDVLVFTGEVVHAGAAYRKENTRIHFYLETAAHPRPRDMTWLIGED